VADIVSIVNVLKAAGEETRLRLLALLAGGELPVKDLTDILDQSQPRVSRHLKLLVDAGLVDRHAEGAWAYFSLSGAPEAQLVRAFLTKLDVNDATLTADRRRLDALREVQREKAAGFFSSVAESWDQLRRLHVPDEAIETEILRIGRAVQPDMLVDLGTGTGRMLELLAPVYKRGVGIDSSREMIGVARAKLADSDIGHAHIRLGDIADLPGMEDQADLVVLHQVLHYFDDPGHIISRARDMLAPGGRIMIIDFAPHELEFLRGEQAHRRLGMSEKQMEAWADAAGLTVDEYMDFPGSGDGSLTVCLWTLAEANGD